MKGKELPCTQNTFAPKRVQCRILSKHKHFSSIGILGEGEYIEMEKQERQAARSRVSVQKPSVKCGSSDGSQSVERPSAPESFKVNNMNPPKPLKAGTWISKDGELMETKDVRLWARQLTKKADTLVRSAHAADPIHADVVINDIRKQAIKLHKELLFVAGDEKT